MNILRIVGCSILFGLFAGAFIVEAADRSDQTRTDLLGLSLEELMKIEVATVYGASKFEQKKKTLWRSVKNGDPDTKLQTDQDNKPLSQRKLEATI
ncbi:MAG: hypothetical protein WA610_02675 [Thermodesulfovibrionales bacterium]